MDTHPLIETKLKFIQCTNESNSPGFLHWIDTHPLIETKLKFIQCTNESNSPGFLHWIDTHPLIEAPVPPWCSAMASSRCWKMKGWLQIFLSCMIVFIMALDPPRPYRGLKETCYHTMQHFHQDDITLLVFRRFVLCDFSFSWFFTFLSFSDPSVSRIPLACMCL